LEKTRLKELDKKEKHDLKAKEKTEKGKRKKIVEVQDPTIDSAVVDEVFQQMSDPHQGTKRDTSHLSLTEEPIVMDAIVDAQQILDELIMNSSQAIFLPIEGPKPQAYLKEESFMDKVRLHTILESIYLLSFCSINLSTYEWLVRMLGY
jgi:hypothetical protein